MPRNAGTYFAYCTETYILHAGIYILEFWAKLLEIEKHYFWQHVTSDFVTKSTLTSKLKEIPHNSSQPSSSSSGIRMQNTILRPVSYQMFFFAYGSVAQHLQIRQRWQLHCDKTAGE